MQISSGFKGRDAESIEIAPAFCLAWYEKLGRVEFGGKKLSRSSFVELKK